MIAPFLAAKLYKPVPRPNAVLRRRLTGKLEQGAYRKLTLISAPAGYGKTSLVCEWLRDCGRAAAWLSLEAEDRHPARFMTGIISALGTLEGSPGAGLLAALQSPQPPSTESVLTVLLREIGDMARPAVLVLDDYPAANAEEADGLLRFLIEQLPPGLHLVLTTREDPDLPLARLRARDQLTELRAADLKFTPAEAELFLNEAMELDLSAEQVRSLESRTEGWIAGLHLAALSVRGEEDPGPLIDSFTGGHRFVLDYLVEEVLRRQSGEMQHFLLRTSILGRLSGPLCDAVMAESGAGAPVLRSGRETLIELDERNLFIVPLDAERSGYRYHPLFAGLLRKRLGEMLTEAELGELHAAAGLWHERHGDELEAFRHAAQSGDSDRAARLLAGGGLPLHLRGASAPALEWLESLQTGELDARPSLWVFYASALLMVGRPTGVEAKLRAAERHGQDVPKWVVGLIAATRAALISLSLNGGTAQGRSADTALLRAEAAMRETESAGDKTDQLIGLVAPIGHVPSGAHLPGERPEIQAIIFQSRRALAYLGPEQLPIRTAAAWMLGVACQSAGDLPAARAAYEEVVAASRLLSQPLLAATAAVGLGRLDEAERKFRFAQERYREALRLGGSLPLPAVREARDGLARLNGRGQDSGPLSPREAEVLRLIAAGLSNRKIGERLFLSLDTVKGHNRRIFEKLQVERRTEAVARARESGWLGDSDADADVAKPH